MSEGYSKLWGKSGELWDPQGRLPDYSYAGYHAGEKSIPERKVTHNVRDFGAKGDGESDDLEAFRAAVAELPDEGCLLVPKGKYLLGGILNIDKSRVTLRGEGEESTLHFTKSLSEVYGHMVYFPGQKSPWNWGQGGLLWVGQQSQHYHAGRGLSNIIGSAERGDRSVRVQTSRFLEVGQRVALNVNEDLESSFGKYMHPNDDNINYDPEYGGLLPLEWFTTIEAIDGDEVTFSQPLRFDIRPEWTPRIIAYFPLEEIGIEDLRVEFPDDEAYAGHLLENGRNAIDLYQAMNCWVKNVEVANCDNGLIFEMSKNCEVRDFRLVPRSNIFEIERAGYLQQFHGHHGITFGRNAADNLVDGFRFDTRFFHDITMNQKCSGNVICNGSGPDVNFDHHRNAPFENLFSNIHTGKGTRLYESSGNAKSGPHAGCRQTFWNITSDEWDYPLSTEASGIREPWDKYQTNIIPCRDEVLSDGAAWLEKVEGLVPSDLYRSQFEFRAKG